MNETPPIPVIFDLDGTLLDTLGDLAASTNYALRAEGLPERTLDEVRRFVGNGVRLLMERAVPGGAAHPRFELLLATFKRHYVDHCLDRTAPYAGVDAMLRALKARGHRIAIVSNKLQSGVTALYETFFRDTVEVAVGERPEVRRKPAPDMVRQALCELGCASDNALYVGDSDVDVATARAAGVPCISVLWGFRDRDFLIRHGATCFADCPADVVRWVDVFAREGVLPSFGIQSSSV